MSQFKPVNIFAVGSTTWDKVRIHPTLTGLSDTKQVAKHTYSATGGGGANFVLALRGLAQTFDIPSHITLCTKIGVPPDNADAINASSKVKEELFGITIIDAVRDQENNVPDNVVIVMGKQRFISTAFNKAAEKFYNGIETDIDAGVSRSNLVFIHTRYPRQSLMAAEAAHRHGIPVFMDYSVTEWPSDETTREVYKQLLQYSTYVVAPAEALLDDMTELEDPQGNADLLLSRIKSYGVPYIAVSNNSHPVMASDHGQYFTIPVISNKKPADLLGVGDARNAGTALTLSQGYNWRTALEMGTKIASFSAGYPGREWLKDIGNEFEMPSLKIRGPALEMA